MFVVIIVSLLFIYTYYKLFIIYVCIEKKEKIINTVLGEQNGMVVKIGGFGSRDIYQKNQPRTVQTFRPRGRDQVNGGKNDV